MELHPYDPDVKTLVSRIIEGDIILDPDFQRGEVWGEQKKKRLIDSILRRWHVPPIHVIEVNETAKQEVLDGQQRLAAIRDFVTDRIPVDGRTEPLDPEIQELDGLCFSQLPEAWRRRFNNFTIRLFVIRNYSPEEPGELFYRLNQPTNLTAAEQRNAFFGPARQQVKELVGYWEEVGLAKATVGFSNSRMAYDDVVSKLCVTLDNGTLLTKVTAGSVTARYRSRTPFTATTIARAQNAIHTLSSSLHYLDYPVKLNKATVYTWLCFIVGLETAGLFVTPDLLSDFIGSFENDRAMAKSYPPEFGSTYLLAEFNDRASSRVADVSSVVNRDAILWAFFVNTYPDIARDASSVTLQASMPILKALIRADTEFEAEEYLEELVKGQNWGKTL